MQENPFPGIRFSGHAKLMMRRRNITDFEVRSVLDAPEQSLLLRPGRVVLQSRRMLAETNRNYLIRVFIDVDRRPPEIVTVYRTSKIDKYWEEPK